MIKELHQFIEHQVGDILFGYSQVRGVTYGAIKDRITITSILQPLAICEIGITGFDAMNALSTNYNDNPAKASRALDKDRDGFVMSEGSAILVLEELEHAKARGAKIYCEIAGYGASCDAYHITAPDPTGAGAAGGLGYAFMQYLNAKSKSGIQLLLDTIRFKELVKNAAGRDPEVLQDQQIL